MATTDLQIKISADVAELKTAMAQAQAQIKALGTTAQSSGAQGAAGLDKTTEAATGAAAAAEQTKGAFDKVKSAGDVVAVVMDKIKAGDLRGAMTAGAQGATILTAAMRTLGVALLTNPITLAITALGALGAAAYSAITAVSGAQDKFAATADSLDKLSAQTGIAASTLQNYKGLATLTNTSIDSVAHSLGFMQRQMAGMGDDPSNNMLERLGVESTDTTEALIETATAIEALGSDAEKTAARMGVFGRGGNEIAGFLSKVAQLGPLAGDALNGLVKTQSDSALATAAQVEALGKLGDLISEGKTNALAASTIESRKEADLASVAYSSLGGMVTSWKELTVYAGQAWAGFKTRTIDYMVDMRGAWQDLCNLFVGSWEWSTNQLKQGFYSFVGAVASGLATLNSALGNTSAAAQYKAEAMAANANAEAAAQAIKAGSAKVVAAINDTARKEVKAKFDKAKAAADAATKGGEGAKGTGKLGAKKETEDGKANDKAKQIADAQYQLQKTLLENEQKLIEDALKDTQKAYDDAYAQGLLSITDYYNTRETIERTRLESLSKIKDAELAEAQKRKAVSDKLGDVAGSLKAQTEIEKIKLDVVLNKAALDRLPAKTTIAVRKAQDELNSAALKVNIELQQLQGIQLDRATIETSIREQYKSLFDKFKTDPAMTAKLEAIVNIKVNTQDFEQKLKDLDLKAREQSQPLDNRAAQVQAQQQNGTLSAPRAQVQLDAIKEQQAAKLAAYITQLQALRDTLDQGEQSADKLQQKLDMDAKINTLSINLAGLKAPVMDLSVTLENSLQGGLENAFNAMIDGTKSAKQAFGDMAKAVIADITKMIIKMLVMKAIKAAFGGGFADGGAVGDGSPAQAFASGGSVRGAGGPRDDAIPAWLSNGEHVIDARTVAAFGGHGVFNALRALGNGRGSNGAMDKISAVLGNIGASVAANAAPPNPRGFAFADGGAVAAPAPAQSSTPMQLVQNFHFAAESDPRSRSQAAAAAFSGAQRALQRNG